MTPRKPNAPQKLSKTLCDGIAPSISGGSKAFLWDLEVPGFGAYKTSLGRVTFVFQYRMRGGGKAQRYTIGTMGAFTVQTARDRARELAVNVATGTDPVATERESRQKAVVEEAKLLGRYFVTFLAEREIEKNPLSRSLHAAMINDVLPRLGSMHMEAITVQQLRQMRLALLERSKTAWRNAIEATKLVMNHAKNSEIIFKAATDKVATPKSDKRERAFNAFELTRYLEAVSDIGGARGDAFRMIILLCRRLREITKMRWSEIDQREWKWMLPGQRTKNGKPMFLALPRQAIEIITRQQSDPMKRRGFVFVHTERGKLHGVGLENGLVLDTLDACLDRRLDLWAERAGALRPSFDHFNIHDQRTTVATNMQQKPLSVPEHIIEALLHHIKKRNGLVGVYQLYDYPLEVGEALQRWADHIDTLMAAADAWPGGRTLPEMDVAERERRALHMREDWTERKKLYKITKKTGLRGGPPRKASLEVPLDENGMPLPKTLVDASGGRSTYQFKRPEGRQRKEDRRGIVKAIAEGSDQIRLHPRSPLAGHEALLREMVAADPEARLNDIRRKLEQHGITVSAVSTIWRCLAQLGISAAPAKQRRKPAAERRKISVKMKAPAAAAAK